ncbi:hypothetical protein N9359_03430 [Luminiphilus sp.]|nr:hypothetical protein [Luminiphilus sp.]
MSAGAGIAQVIPILSNVFLAVAIGAAQFGFFSLWLGIVYLGAVFSTLRLENALFIEKQGTARVQGMKAIVKVMVVPSLVGAFGLVALACMSPSTLPNLPLPLLSVFIPAAALLGLNNTVQAFVVSNGSYTLINKIRVLQAVSVALVQCFLVWKTPTAMSMAIGFVLGQAFCMMYAVIRLKGTLFFPSANCDPLSFTRRHWRFPAFSLPADSLSSFGALLPVALVGSHYGADAAGQIALTIRVLAAPVSLLGKAIQDVFKREAVLEIAERGTCRQLYFIIVLALLPVVALFILILQLLGPAGFVFLFGEDWSQAGDISRTLAPVFGISLLASPLSYIVYLVNRQHVDLFWQAALVICVWFSLTQFSTLEEAVKVYAYVYTGMYLVSLVVSYRLCAFPCESRL